MRFQISSLLEYANFLLKKYSELQQNSEKNIYRIVEIKQSSFGQYKLIIQIVGKSSVIECSPQEIVMEDWLLEGFSKKDIRIITYLACEERKIPKYKIISQEFSDKHSKILFILKDNNNTYITRTASQIVIDKDLLSCLAKDDINCISYIAGYECSQDGIEL